MSPPVTLWWRNFLRSDANDIDTECTPQFLLDNFTDFFGQFLQQGNNAAIFTLDALLRVFFDKPQYKFTIYCAAEGAFIPHPDPSNPATWFNPHVRFTTVVQPNPLTDNPWTLFIVGSSEPTSEERFLQVISWDSTINEYRYYGKEEVQPGGQDPADGVYGWVYQGRSSYAFDQNTTYLGPFNGHVNGALVMKELEKPWYHWKSGENSNLIQCLSDVEKALFNTLPYLSGMGVPVYKVASAENMQMAIENGIMRWYNRRSELDFPEPSGGPASTTRVAKRWMAHMLLTTTVNISTAAVNPNLPGQAWFPPIDHFLNNMMLKMPGFSDLLPEFPVLAFTKNHYTDAVSNLGLCLIQENLTSAAIPGYQNLVAMPGTLGGGKGTDEHSQQNFVVAHLGEGVPFVIVQPSYEDAQGVLKMQFISSGVHLLSQATFNAIMMLDICNPVYSWRRGVLMDYVPETTTWDPTTRTYDLEARFLNAVAASPHASDPDTPEKQFLELCKLDTPTLTSKISAYMTAVKNRIKTRDGLVEYLALAESRRRIFRPLPLSEFGYTLPYASKYTLTVPWEMKMDGTTGEMPARGAEWISKWTGTLWGDNPILVPVTPDKVRTGAKTGVGMGAMAGRHIPCDGQKRYSKSRGCPFAGSVKTMRCG